MGRTITFLLFFLSLRVSLIAQETIGDSTLREVVVEAYASDRALEIVPASIGIINQVDLARFNGRSLLPAINAVPGVRMEERSPGSYRISIRGSSLRSPFGVRNVKVYWNGLPRTDAGGNTYVNLIDINNVNSVEIIKGPGGSLYGAGTGGVVLFSTPRILYSGISAASTFGSYGLRRYSLSGQLQREKVNATVRLSRQSFEGYREQTSTERTSFHSEIQLPVNERNFFSTTLFYTDLFYQTPGGLTLDQFKSDASQARPATATGPGAREQDAAVYNKTFFGGINHEHQWREDLSTTSGLSWSTSNFSNPAIRNFEERDEKNIGARTVTQYGTSKGEVQNTITGGLEFQHLASPIGVYQNNGGTRGDTTSQDKLSSTLFLFFAQNEIAFAEKFYVTLGLSANFNSVGFQRKQPTVIDEERNFDPIVLPRIAILAAVSRNINLFATYSHGFSPPTVAELYPSRNIFDKELNPEKGKNYEVGVKGFGFGKALYFELSAYKFALDETIVIRTDPSIPGDPEYFVNAGETDQLGVEALIKHHAIKNEKSFFSDILLTGSYAYNHYRFNNYFQGDEDFSGNKLTGVPPTTAYAALDLALRKKIYFNIIANYVDHIPLNDANTAFGEQYVLLNGRGGYHHQAGPHLLELFAGVENALDEVYSLGHDLNAAAGRYYNPAPRRSYYLGFKLNILAKP
jgi:iron complex outermembrane recepter protein